MKMSARSRSDTLIEVEGASFTYPDGTRALNKVSVKVWKGNVVAITGANGSGKSTLLMLMAGLLEPQEGIVKFRGIDVRKLGYEVRREIGIVFQDPDDQLFNPTVEEELLFTLVQLGLSEGERAKRVEEVAELLGIKHLLRRPTFALSYGEKRRVALASILVYDPEYLLLDEPTANLDARSAAQFTEVICNARAGGKGVLVATQDVSLALALADRVYVLHNGSLVWEGEKPPQSLLESYGLLQRVTPCGRRPDRAPPS